MQIAGGIALWNIASMKMGFNDIEMMVTFWGLNK